MVSGAKVSKCYSFLCSKGCWSFVHPADLLSWILAFRIDEEEFGGHQSLAGEGTAPSMALFLVGSRRHLVNVVFFFVFVLPLRKGPFQHKLYCSKAAPPRKS